MQHPEDILSPASLEIKEFTEIKTTELRLISEPTKVSRHFHSASPKKKK